MTLKTFLSTVCTVLPLLTFVACSNDAPNTADKKAASTKPISFSAIQSVPLAEATNAIHAYGEWWRSQNLPDSTIANITRAFLIPGSDLIGVLEPVNGASQIIDNCNFKQARAYLGLDANNVIHLYLTPVNEQGVDVILTNPENGEQHVFDLTTPCPRTCDEASELYKAFN